MIGIALVNFVIKEGHEVIAIVRPESAGIDSLPSSEKIKICICDISDYESLYGIDECDIFFHLAWGKTVASARDDTDVQLKNLKCTLDAVRLAKSWNARAFIGAGSQAEYGLLNKRADDDTPTNPTSGYGIAKFSAGKMAKLLCKQLDIRFCWSRIFSVYGEHDRGHTLVMYLINTMLNGGSPELTKCEQMWDYLYSSDAARALLAIGLNGKDGQIYPIGSGECKPLKEYITEVRDSMDPNIELSFGVREYYPHQQMFLCADIRKLTADTGFVPKYSFKEGIARTISFVETQNNKVSNKFR